jgi:hypothetical protein
MHALVDEQPAAGVAVLALVIKDAERRPGHGLAQFGVVEDDVRRLAAELKLRRPHQLGAGMQNLAPGHGAVRKGQHVNVGMAREGGARRGAAAAHDIEDARRNAGIERHLRRREDGEAGQLRGFEHHRVAAAQRRRELPGRDIEREVPRRDLADDAAGLAQNHVAPGQMGGHKAEGDPGRA